MRLTKKETRVMAFLLLLLVITVGYALLSQTLDINGTSKIKKTTWSIIWDNVQVNSNSVSGTSVTQAAQITNTEKTLVEYSITLSEPGEFYEFTIDAKNEGTIDGMINVVSNKTYESNGTTEKTLPAYLTYSVTYSDGKAIAPKQLLKAGSTEKYKVRVEFKDVEASLLPAQEETIKFKFSVDYVQADDTGEEVVHGLTGTRYTVNKYTDNQYVYIGQKPANDIILYETAAEARSAFNNSPVWLKHEIESDIVKESRLCFEKNNNTYCLQGGIKETDENGVELANKPVYDANKAVLQSAFESNQCNESYEDSDSNPPTGLYFHCYDDSEDAYAYAYGYVLFQSISANKYCRVYAFGSSDCYAW